MVPTGIESVGQLSGQWWVGHTRPRFEKSLAWDLAERGVGYFLPLIERVRFSGGRKRRVLMPLFPSYVFFCGTDEDRHAVMRTDRLVRTIAVSNQHELREELSQLETAIRSKGTIDLYPFAAVGSRCRVTSGPFMGIEGVVVSRNETARLVLQVGILGQGAALEIDADVLEAVD